jgi:hypothetical protein
MKRTRRPCDAKTIPTQMADAQLTDVKGGASMVEYALLLFAKQKPQT